MEKIKEIRAQQVTVEVKDIATGQVFRRTLPIEYVENAHGLRLMGENASGEPVSMVFYSSAGLARLKDMTGGGANEDPCGAHSH